MRPLQLLICSAATVLMLTACGGSPEAVGEKELEKQIETKMTEYAGQAPDRIDCPEEGLKAEVEATQRCVLYAGEDKLGITATVTSVEDNRVNFDIKADEKVME